MFLFKRAIGPENLKRAEDLLITANLLPETSFASLLQLYPDFQGIADSGLLQLWDDLVATAAVGAAFKAIADKLPENEWRGIGNAIKYKMNQGKSGSFEVMINFCDYFCKLLKETALSADLIVGGWVWGNLAQSPKSTPELKRIAISRQYAKVTGFVILDIFYNWWDENHAQEFGVNKITPLYFKSCYESDGEPELAPIPPR